MALRIPAIDEIELPREICRSATGGYGGQTTIIVSGNAREQRNIDWPISRSLWTIMWVTRTTDPLFQSLIAFFRARYQRAYGFRFYDWADHSDWGNGKVELVDGAYQMTKHYPDAIRPTVKNIFKPISGTVTLHSVTGTPVIDYTTGIVSGATSAGTWTGEFNIPVRFDTDAMKFTVTPDTNVIWDGVPLIELL